MYIEYIVLDLTPLNYILKFKSEMDEIKDSQEGIS